MTLYAKFIDFKAAIDYINTLIPNIVEDDLSLPLSYNGYILNWDSSNKNVLKDDGTFTRPYKSVNLKITCEIMYDGYTYTVSYDLDTVTYKSLESNIMSGYVFLNFPSVDNTLFDTHDIIYVAFAIADANLNFNKNQYTYYFNQVSQYIIPKAKETGTYVVMSIGPESSWSTIASNPTLISGFANKIVELINTYGFDGVDIDWETPTSAEATKYTALMQEVYTKVKANNPNHLVTTAIAGGMWQVQRYDLQNSINYIDYINLMMYDMSRNNGQYQNPLYKRSGYAHSQASAGATLTSTSIAETVDLFNKTYNVPYSKMIIGLPLYGVKQVRSYTNGSWSSYQSAGTINYHDIVNNYMNNPSYTYYFDDVSKVPYLIKNDYTEFISFDNTSSATIKANYVKDNNLAGVMYWQYAADNTRSIVNALYNALKN